MPLGEENLLVFSTGTALKQKKTGLNLVRNCRNHSDFTSSPSTVLSIRVGPTPGIQSTTGLARLLDGLCARWDSKNLLAINQMVRMMIQASLTILR